MLPNPNPMHRSNLASNSRLLKKSKTFLLLLLPLFLLIACDRSIFYEEIRHVENSEWNATDTLFFQFNVTDTLEKYDFGFNVRNTTSYPFQNLYLFITAWYPDGSWSRDTAECILAAPDGRWYGKGNGKIRDSRFLFRKNVSFRNSGIHRIAVNQAMRTEQLEGIADVGIRVVQSAK